MIVSEIPYTEEYIEATCSQPKTSESTLQLGSVKCYNINIQVEVEKSEQQAKGITTLTLREVPKFLVDAFNIIRSNIEKEGLFRKGGNNARINSYSKKILAIYQGRERIPLDLNYLDVCSLIKTFFKTLKHPLLHSRDIANALLTLADRKGAGESVSQHNDRNGMTIQNLATCFGPTLFDLTAFDKPKGVPKRSMPGRVQTNPPTLSQLNEAKADSQRAATAVTILIEWATWIGLTRECYVSSQARSSSAAPINRTPLSQLQAASIPLDKRTSLPSPNDPAIVRLHEEQAEQRRKLVARQPTPGPSGSNSHKQPSFTISSGSTTPVKSQRPPALPREVTSPSYDFRDIPNMERVIRRLDFSPLAESPAQATPAAKKPASPMRQKNARTKSNASDYKNVAANNVWAQSMIPSTTQTKKERRRRHTTPVKSNVLRRHHPNTVANGLPRRRVTQAITAEEKENVMRRRTHSVEDLEETTGDSSDDILENRAKHLKTLWMDLDARPRRTKRLKRRDANTETSTANAATSPMLPAEPSHKLGPTVVPSRNKYDVTPLSITTEQGPGGIGISEMPSPQRILQVTPVQSPVATRSPHHNYPNQPAVQLISAVARHTAVPAVVHERAGGLMDVRVEPVTKSMSAMPGPSVSRSSLYSRHADVYDRKPPAPPSPDAVAKDRARQTIIQQLSLDSQMVAEPVFKVPAPPGNLSRTSAARQPLSPGYARSPTDGHRQFQLQFEDDSPIANNVVRSPIQQSSSHAMQSPLSRRGMSASLLGQRHAVYSPSKSLQRQLSVEEFRDSDRYRDSIVAASSSSELDMGQNFEPQRPSVAFISTNRRGLVRDRVNMFGGGSTHNTPQSHNGSGRLSEPTGRRSDVQPLRSRQL
ncbi:unnamed protein product, partial [Mesorhabditis spiculigera]